MTLWIILTAMTVVLAVALAVPIIRRFDAPRSDRDRLIEVSRDQMAEVDADLARGLIGEREAGEARQEIERRALAAVKREPDQPRPSSDRARLTALAIVTGWLVVGAIGLYAVVGRPDLPSVQRGGLGMATASTPPPTETTVAATGQTDMTAQTGSVEEMIASLIARLDNDPSDAGGWQMLGWSYFNTERYAQAADAYAKAVALDASDPDVWSAYGETLVRSARGMVSHDALTAFDEALALNPADPRARFFKGMALEQAGDPQAAIDAWLDIVDSAPGDADWLPGVVQRIEELAATEGIDLDDRLASAPATGGILGTDLSMPPARSNAANSMGGPTADDVAAAAEMAPEDRQAMIRGMVEGLAARLEDAPDDPEGWARLVTSRMVLNDPDGAAAAFARAREIFADSPDKLAIVRDSARSAGLATD